MISFIAATYNEENEIISLLDHVQDFVDYMYVCDDGSTDATARLLGEWKAWEKNLEYKVINHTGLPETVKNEALQMVPDGSWVLMLDADERFETRLSEIIQWVASADSEKVDYVYFNQYEIIDGNHVRTFQKCKLFRKESITFSTGIHEDDQFKGFGAFYDWKVIHRKSSNKQKQREREYLDTYKKLLDEGKIDNGRYEWLRNLHHYER